MSPYQQPTCVYCRENIPHERHVTVLEHAKLFSGAEEYARTNDGRLLGKSGSESVRKVS